MSPLSAWLRIPALHFVLIGAVLFGLSRWLPASPAAHDAGGARDPIVISATQLDQLRADFTRQTGLNPTPEDEALLIKKELEEQVLYREALAHGLAWGDRGIQWRLISKMRFLNDDPELDDADLYRQALELGLEQEDIVVRRILVQKMRMLIRISTRDDDPSEAELAGYLELHRDDYLKPARVSLSHVFFSTQQRGDGLERDAAQVAAELRSGSVARDQGARLGDPFPLGWEFRSASKHGLAKTFGGEFAEQAMQLTSGRWSGPIPSPYGLHLVFVTEKVPAQAPALETVRSQVLRRLVAERRDEHLASTLRGLREEYEVRIEGGAAPSAEGA